MRRSSNEVNVGQREDVPSLGWMVRAYLWACERLYAELAPMYDVVSWLVSAGQWRRWQSGLWQEVLGREVLELGCGTGAMVVSGTQHGLKVAGVDRSPAMLGIAQHRVEQEIGFAPLILGDGRSLPLSDGLFDSAVATFPAGYILKKKTLAEIRRVLRVDGRLVLLGLWVELHLGIAGQFAPVFYGRPNQASLDAIVKRVEAAGFHARWVEQRDGYFTIGVLVADRE